MSFNVTKMVLPWFFLVGLCFPISFEVENNSHSLMGQAWALSSESMPLTSNIFVDIAKQQNPAVVSGQCEDQATEKLMVDLGTPGARGRESNFVTSMINFLDNNRDQGETPPPGEEELDQGSLLMLMGIF